MLGNILKEVSEIAALRLRTQGDIARARGQTRAAWQVLAAASPHGGTVPQLARKLGQTRQSVQRVADGLVERGLALYARNPSHRRSPRLELTAAGTETLAGLEREAVRREPDTEDDIEPEDLETTLYVLRALRDAL